MQARELLLFHSASTTSWEQQQKQLSLSGLLSHMCAFSLSTQTFVSSRLFDYHFLPSLLKIQSTSLFPSSLFFFDLWVSLYILPKEKRRSHWKEKKISSFKLLASDSVLSTPFKKSSDKIVSLLPWSYCFWGTFEERQRHVSDMTV